MKIKVLWILVGVVTIIWLSLSFIPLYCALYFTCDPDAGSFWTLFLQAVTVPILLVELYRLRKTMESAIWTPEIEVGFAIAPVDATINFESKAAEWDTISIIEAVEKSVENPGDFSSSSDFETSPSYFKDAIVPLRFVIRNRGKAVAKYLKIVLSLTGFPDGVVPEISSRDKRLENSPDGLTFIYRQDPSQMLFPGDFEVIVISFNQNRNQWEKIFSEIGNGFPYWSDRDGLWQKINLLKGYSLMMPNDGIYTWRVTIWVEGENKAIVKDLSITVSNKDLLALIESYEQQAKTSEEGIQRTTMAGPMGRTTPKSVRVVR